MLNCTCAALQELFTHHKLTAYAGRGRTDVAQDGHQEELEQDVLVDLPDHHSFVHSAALLRIPAALSLPWQERVIHADADADAGWEEASGPACQLSAGRKRLRCSLLYAIPST